MCNKLSLKLIFFLIKCEKYKIRMHVREKISGRGDGEKRSKKQIIKPNKEENSKIEEMRFFDL